MLEINFFYYVFFICLYLFFYRFGNVLIKLVIILLWSCICIKCNCIDVMFIGKVKIVIEK